MDRVLGCGGANRRIWGAASCNSGYVDNLGVMYICEPYIRWGGLPTCEIVRTTRLVGGGGG